MSGFAVPGGGRTASSAATVTPISAAPAESPAPSAVTASETGSMSDVHDPPHRIERRLGDRLGQGGVRVDRQIHFLDRVFVLPRDRQLVDDLGGVAPDDVGPQDLAVLLVPHDLHEALGLPRRAGAAVGAEREAADLIVQLLLLRLLLGEADARHLGMAIGDAGY